jgi:hypothetical protein
METKGSAALDKYAAAMKKLLPQFPITSDSLEMLDALLSTYR